MRMVGNVGVETLSEKTYKRSKMTKCPYCNGEGWYPILITVAVCCQCPGPTGECCQQPIAGQEQQQEQCGNCQGTGKIEEDI